MNQSSSPATADLCDAYIEELQVLEPILQDLGGTLAFGGGIETVKVFEDNVLVRQTLETSGQGRVLVVDGGGSCRRALVGDRLAALAKDNGWAGIVVYGCIRDSAEIAGIEIGLKALATHPCKSDKRGDGQVGIPVTFGGVRFEPGHWLYADADGVVVSPRRLELPAS